MENAASRVPLKNDTAKKMKVLVVDDDYLIRTVLTRIMGDEGFEATAADSLANAEAHLHENSFDLVITDIMLSDARPKEGLALARKIRSAWPETRVVAMTGRGSEDMRREAMQCGVLWFYEKPFDIVVFTERVANLFKNTVNCRC